MLEDVIFFFRPPASALLRKSASGFILMEAGANLAVRCNFTGRLPPLCLCKLVSVFILMEAGANLAVRCSFFRLSAFALLRKPASGFVVTDAGVN